MADAPPFAGLKVFDATQGVAGPHIAMLLAQHGADVVKMEPLSGDWIRYSGQAYGDLTASLLNFARGKRSIALDLKSPEGCEIAQMLARQADVVLESFRPGVMARFGLDYDSVRRDNPDVIYASTSGFGPDGPNRDLPVTDMVMQGFTGWMSINRDKDGTPQRIGMVAIDVLTGLYGYHAVSTALYKRATQGVGAHIEISLMEAAGAFQASVILANHLEGGELRPLGAPIGTYRTADGYINMNARSQEQFAALCGIINRRGLTADARFATWDDRIDNRDELDAILRPIMPSRTTADWASAFRACDIIHTPVNDYPAYLGEPQVTETDVVSWIEHEMLGALPLHNIPGVDRMTGDDSRARAPHIGEHTRDILQELGYAETKIDTLVATAVVGDYESGHSPDRQTRPRSQAP